MIRRRDKMALSCLQICLMIGMLVTGSINTISKKAQNDCISPGYPDPKFNHTSTPHSFDHPWFQTIIMFVGEMLCLLGLCVMRKWERDALKNQTLQKVINSDEEEVEFQQPRIFQWIFIIPTVCDLVGTSLAGIGLVYVDASVWQMLRGSIIIFAGILSKIFLKRKLTCLHWTGMLMTMIGLVLVGISSVFKNNHSNAGSKVILGIILIVASQLVSASQMVIEELFLKKRGSHPLQVVGMEGSFGFTLMAAIVLPAMYFIPGPQVNNSYENSLDALYQIANDYKLLIFCLLYLLSIAFYNYFGLAVTKSLTAVHRTLIDACRTLLVWMVDLIIFYAFGGSFGEPFDKYWGLLQVDGFLFLLIGTAMYNQLIDLSWLPCSCFKPLPPVLGIPGNHDNSYSPNRKGQIQEDSFEEEVHPEDIDERTRLIHSNPNLSPSYS